MSQETRSTARSCLVSCEGQGHEIVTDVESADTVIVNTCGFIEEAQQESIDTILEIAATKGDGDRSLLVAGCMVNRYGQELANEIPEIDGFVSLDQLQEVDQLVQIGAPPAAAVTLTSSVRSHRAAIADHTWIRLPEGRRRL